MGIHSQALPEAGHMDWYHCRHIGYLCAGTWHLRSLPETAWFRGNRDVGGAGNYWCRRVAVRHCDYSAMCLAGSEQVPENDGRRTV